MTDLCSVTARANRPYMQNYLSALQGQDCAKISAIPGCMSSMNRELLPCRRIDIDRVL